MAQPKLHEIAKSLDIPSKQMIEKFAEYGKVMKNHMAKLEPEDVNLIFTLYLNQFDDGSTIEEYFEKRLQEKKAEEKKAAPKKEDSSKPDAKTEEKFQPVIDDTPLDEEALKIVKQDNTKVVDTRTNNVDLNKLDTEKIEKLVDLEATDKVERKQKLKKGSGHKKPEKDIDNKKKEKVKQEEKKNEPKEVMIPEEISVGEFAERLGENPTTIVKKLFELGIMAAVSQTIDFDTATLVGEDLGYKITEEVIVTEEDILFNDTEDSPESLKTRSAVVVVMGHVDHGKTSLLDAIRNTNVTAREAGGITQHIGAYRVRVGDKKITFLDTPGHEAFTAMRARGAQVTDVAILVVAADDGIMPQTVEAINHAKAAGVTIIVAINKIDKEGANPDRIMQELTEYELIPEAWGGDTICVPISAKHNQNIEELLEMVILVADMKELKANPDRRAKGTVIESSLDKGRGPVATVLVQNGTLRTGDIVVAGTAVGRVRAMMDDRGANVKKAGPSVPVEILGLSEAPSGGDTFYVVEDERKARNVVEKRKQKIKDEANSSRQAVTLDALFDQIKEGNMKELNIIVKADVQGSVEAVKQSLEKLSNEEVRVRCIHGGVGGVTESDVMLASASNAIIVGFNVRPDSGAISTAKRDNVDIRLYRIIYQAIEEIEAAMKGMLEPEFVENLLGHAEVRNTFKVSGVGTIAGGYVVDGKISRNSQVRIVRDGIIIHEGVLSSLKRFKDDAKEVAQGYECGIGIENYNDIKDGDIIESFVMEEVKR
ncbi:MAG: translation initiation factor IF-2 [Ruminococcaceae bacterium]|nr:translation initiation factor IF-2 [Oscillospiraceae bacterium]